ncbi:MAG: hypothetical protein AABW50_01050 [Nanoarchaeota archaeon]
MTNEKTQCYELVRNKGKICGYTGKPCVAYGEGLFNKEFDEKRMKNCPLYHSGNWNLFDGYSDLTSAFRENPEGHRSLLRDVVGSSIGAMRLNKEQNEETQNIFLSLPRNIRDLIHEGIERTRQI